MHVLIISTMEGAPWGGSEELWSASAMALLGRRHQVTVSVKAWPSAPPTISLLSKHGAIIRYRENSRFARFKRRFRDPEQSLLGGGRPDLAVISQGGNQDGLDWMEACQAANVPYVVIAQAALPWYWPPDEV